jgi:hypothetical protein
VRSKLPPPPPRPKGKRVNHEVYEQSRGYRRDRWLDGVVAVITWITFLVVGVAIGLVIGYWQWYEATP